MALGHVSENNVQMVYLEEGTRRSWIRDNLPDDPFELTHASQMLSFKEQDQIDHINEVIAHQESTYARIRRSYTQIIKHLMKVISLKYLEDH